jgi:hypothetical protein
MNSMGCPDLTKEAFQAWLEANEVIEGRKGGRCGTCPIARFVQSQGFHYVSIGAYQFNYGHKNTGYKGLGGELPGWAVQFIGQFDTSKICDDSELKSSDLLNILKDCK